MQKVCTRCKCILIAQQSCRKSSLNKRVSRKTVSVNVALDHFYYKKVVTIIVRMHGHQG